MPVAINTGRPASAAARTTTTSRRGGRTRSRSPAVMGGRPPPDVMGENPSSAAAAAAAAAKAFAGTNAGSARSVWPENEDYHPANFEKQSRWPSEDPYRRYPAHYRGRPPSGAPEEYPPPDRRYRPHRYDPSYDRRYARQQQQQQYPPVDYRYDRASSKNPPVQRMGTSLVLGGSTPIHLPKTAPYEQQRGAASVFRGRPDGDVTSSNNKSEDESPQKILLSLRTPTSSFDETKPSKNKGLSLSPEDPPVLQNSHHSKDDQLLEKSPGGNKAGLIDIAPSFVLFNQSFDSFGDGNYFNVESSLQADSFGMARTSSIENPEAHGSLLKKNSSVGATSQQLLTAGSGALTIGFSPVNSFGNPSAPSRRGGNMMVLDGRSPSPTQVLGMYRSYSGGGNMRPEMMEDPQMRGNSSFGGPHRSFGGESSPYYTHRGDQDNGEPPFYGLLRKYKLAFKDCTFLLPGLKAALLEPPSDKMEAKWDSVSNSDSERLCLLIY